jgi:SNF2 family DNA or RNA helicase
VEKWTDFNHLRVGVLHGKNKEKVLEDAIENDSYDILCINPEGLEWLFGVTKRRGRNNKVSVEVDKKRMRWLFGPGAITDLVVDESTKFKHSNSVRFKVLKESLDRFRRRWILTGTPSPNGLLDLFGQLYIVDMGASLGQYITHYRKTYFLPTGFGGYTWRPQDGAEKLIYDRLKKLVLRLDAKDYLELPELVPNIIKFDLPDKARALYDAMEEDMVAQVDDDTVTALSAASAMTKCAQIANGGIYKQADPLVSTKRKRGADSWDRVHDCKDEIVGDLVEEISGQPVLIAYEFEHDLQRLLEVFGKDTPYIGGGVSAKRSKEIEQSWNRGEIPVLLGHPAAMGHGLNLQNAGNHVVWYGLTYDYELYDQFIRRVLRQGSKHKRVFVHHIVARDTVDELKLYALRRKAKGQTALLDALRVYVRDRRAKVARATTGSRTGQGSRKAAPGRVAKATAGRASGRRAGAGRAGR